MQQTPPPEPDKQPGEPAHESKNRPYGEYPPHYGYGYGYGGYGSAAYGEASPGEAGPLGHVTPGRLWQLLRRKTMLILLVTAFGLGVAYFYVQKTTVEVYQANSVIEMSLRKPRVLDQKGTFVDDGYASAEEGFQTRLAKFMSPAMLATVVEKFREIRPDELRNDAELGGLLAGGVAIKVRSLTRLVDITFRSTDPKFAADAANAFAAAAETNVFVENKTTAERSVAWLQTQANAQRKLLADAELELARFKSENNLNVIEGQKNSAQQSIAALNSAAATLASQIVLQDELYRFLMVLKVKPSNVDSLPSKLPSGEQIGKSVEELHAAEAVRDAMAKRYTPEHPDMKAAQAKVTTIQAQLLEGIRQAMKSIATDLDLLRKQSKALQDNIATEQQKLGELERRVVAINAQMRSMEREREAEDSTYKGILARIEEARMSADENTALVRILEKAAIPTTPTKQASLPLLLFGCLLGLFGGFGLALASDTLEDRISSIADVEEVIGVKVLGLIPRIEHVKRAQLALACMSHDYGELTEAFAGIRSVLNSEQYRELAKSILITSSAPTEGKTVVSCNLAIGSAQSGLRTLLVDFDMRRPRLANIFARPKPNQSLLKVLADGDAAKFDELPMPTALKNLQVISTRSTDEANPAEVMASKTVRAFFTWALQNYERVIVDSPPFGIVSDSAVLSTIVGCVIIVCQPEKTRKRSSRYAVRHFAEMGANVIGAVVNKVPFGRNARFGADYYQGPSYYHHGYDYYHNAKARKAGKRRWWQRAHVDTDEDAAVAPGKPQETNGSKVPPP
jgi:capsular exopolysaccharide synthesis family protein